MHLLTNPVRHYAWGSTTRIPDFVGATPTGEPQAELWIGAHDGDPSFLPDGRPLNRAVAETPGSILGSRVADLFEGRLPYLMKVLAVEESLSLQVHPTSERARIGHHREADQEIPVDDPRRNYKDGSHKPELVYALTPFEGLAGFREIERSVALLRLLQVPWADRVADTLESGPAYQALREVVAETLALTDGPLDRILGEVETAAQHALARLRREDPAHHHARDPHHVHHEAVRVFRLVAELTERYPRDPGVLVTLLLNHILLAPGEALFVKAGVVHAYLSGFGVEIMASSDNVLRAGLTPKHVDVPEVLTVTDFTPMPPPRWEPAERTDACVYLEPPVNEFDLTVARTPIQRLPRCGPRVLLVLDGTVVVTTQRDALTLHRGQAVLVEHDDGDFEVTGDGQVAVGSVPAGG